MNCPRNAIDQGIAKAVKAGKRGWSQVTLDSSEKVIGRTHQYACYCLSRGLMEEREICHAHHRPIGSHPQRRQNFGMKM